MKNKIIKEIIARPPPYCATIITPLPQIISFLFTMTQGYSLNLYCWISDLLRCYFLDSQDQGWSSQSHLRCSDLLIGFLPFPHCHVPLWCQLYLQPSQVQHLLPLSPTAKQGLKEEILWGFGGKNGWKNKITIQRSMEAITKQSLNTL